MARVPSAPGVGAAHPLPAESRRSTGDRAVAYAGWRLIALLAGLSISAGCRSVDLACTTVCVAQPPSAVVVLGLPQAPGRLDRGEALGRARAARRGAWRSELDNTDECVDRYYEATVFAYAALTLVDPACRGVEEDDHHALSLYNDSLADCLRTAGAFGRLDPRSRLLVNGPRGTIVVPVVHRGFVWSAEDFERIADPSSARRNPAQRASQIRCGLGAAEVAIRTNPGRSPSDRFLPPQSYFPATAVLRPDLGAWTGQVDPNPGPSPGPDVLELYDPLRVSSVPLAGRAVALTSNLDAPVSMAEEAVDSRSYTLTGFLNPSTELNKAALGFLEPYQPGKVPVVFIHGLLDNPYVFTDMIDELRTHPGFLDRFQVAAYRYPTGSSFLRSAAMLRRKLMEMEATFDPEHRDPGFQNMALVGYSMGGLVSRLQITSSGDKLWTLASSRPLDALVTPEPTRKFLRELFFFEPVPFVRRVVFIASPHSGSGLASNAVGRVASRLVQRPADVRAMVDQITRDNPGVVHPYMASLPSSVDLMTLDSPLLTTIRSLPINPATTYHVIAGTGYRPPEFARGDWVVPLTSAHVDGAASELWVPAIHTNIYRNPQTIAEVDRILQLHLVENGLGLPTAQAGRP
jgi:triacylglycerol esterase/lipase EstA (alpha/beta hydrolase family)